MNYKVDPILILDESKRAKEKLVETQERAVQYKQEYDSLKELNEEITKELKAKDIVFNSLATENVLKEKRTELSEIEKELGELESAWKEANEEMNLNLSRARRQFDEKRVEIEQKQEKIDFYESNYSRLVQDLRSEILKRDNLIEEYKRMPKDTKREYLSEMIFETKQRCHDYETSTVAKLSELKTLNQGIEKVDEEVKYLTKEIETRVGEGEDKKKKDDKSFDKMREAFDKLNKTFQQTKHYMEKFIDLKLKNKQLQDRILDLKRNKYQETCEKIKKDLQDGN